MIWTNRDLAGLLPEFLSEHDPRPAKEQIHENYRHGGGWFDFSGFTLELSSGVASLHYPGDRPLLEVARTALREETIVLFEYDWVAIIQPGGDFAVARID